MARLAMPTLSSKSGHTKPNRRVLAYSLCHVTTVPQSLNFFRGQVGYLQRCGFTVHTISSPNERLTRFGEQEHLAAHGVEMSRRISPVRDLQAVIKLSKTLRRIHPDIVHAHTPKAGLLGICLLYTS